MFIVATRVGRTFPTPRLIPWPPLFLFSHQPSVDVAKPFVANVDERLNQWDAAFINGFDGHANLLFLFASRDIDAYVAQLQDEALLGFDEEALLNNLPQFEDSLRATQYPDGLLHIPNDFPVFVRDEDAQRRTRRSEE